MSKYWHYLYSFFYLRRGAVVRNATENVTHKSQITCSHGGPSHRRIQGISSTAKLRWFVFAYVTAWL